MGPYVARVLASVVRHLVKPLMMLPQKLQRGAFFFQALDIDAWVVTAPEYPNRLQERLALCSGSLYWCRDASVAVEWLCQVWKVHVPVLLTDAVDRGAYFRARARHVPLFSGHVDELLLQIVSPEAAYEANTRSRGNRYCGKCWRGTLGLSRTCCLLRLRLGVSANVLVDLASSC